MLAKRRSFMIFLIIENRKKSQRANTKAEKSQQRLKFCFWPKIYEKAINCEKLNYCNFHEWLSKIPCVFFGLLHANGIKLTITWYYSLLTVQPGGNYFWYTVPLKSKNKMCKTFKFYQSFRDFFVSSIETIRPYFNVISVH